MVANHKMQTVEVKPDSSNGLVYGTPACDAWAAKAQKRVADVLRRYAITKPSPFPERCVDTSICYMAAIPGNMFCLGLHDSAEWSDTIKPEDIFLVDCATKLDLTREELDTLHDYCLFSLSPNRDSVHYQDGIEEMRADFDRWEIVPPKLEDMYPVSGHAYPGSKSFAFEMAGNLVFT